jgi:hypothetical protein
MIREKDPNFVSKIVFHSMPGEGFIKTSLHQSKEGNEILIKKANDNLAYPHPTKHVDETKKDNKTDDDFLSKLSKLEQQINDEVRRKDEERVNKKEIKIEKELKPSIDTTVSFEKLHEYVSTYEISNSKGVLQIFYRDAGREYSPETEAEKRNIEFATYWSVAAGIEETEDDIIIGEKHAFSPEVKKLFDIFDVQFRESVKRGIDVDLESLREQFINSGVENADKIYDRLFKNPYYIEYVTNYYQKSLGINPEKEEKTAFERHSEFGINMEEMERDAKEQAREIQKQNERADLINGAEEQAKELKYINDNLEIINGAIEQAKELKYRNDNLEIINGAIEQAAKLQQINDMADIMESAPQQALEIQKSNDLVDLINGAEEQAKIINKEVELSKIVDGAREQAKELQQKDDIAEIMESAPQQAKQLLQLRDELFEIIEQHEEKQISPEISEIKDAYETVEEYATTEQPTSVKVFFDRENPGTAEVIISNGVGLDETVMYQRTFDEEKLSSEIIPVLCELYAKGNKVTYKQAFDVPNTDKAGLVVVGTLEKTFQVSNAPKKIVELTQKQLNESISKNENENISEVKVA